ncbi:MAG: polysaccharide biosynthesis C-terminal domain-containing protein [Lachnospiraceae bacterium]|nr:polysaccharide biosynthesis C-terminal domain-containing protein [Lachnospiraceae bacterium]
MKEGKYRYLFHNVALFTVSNFVSKVLVFCLVPFYTTVLTESDYGVADVMQTTLLLLVPLLSINAGEAALRFGLEYADSRDEILLYGFRKVVRSIAIVGTLAVALAVALSMAPLQQMFLRITGSSASSLPPYFLLFFLLYICNSLYEYMLLYCQGTEQVQIMITGSVSCTLLVILSNLLFLLVFSMGLLGYLMAQMISFAGAFVLMFVLMGGMGRLRKAGKKEAVMDTRAEKPDGEKETPESGEACPQNLEERMGQYGKSMLLYSTASWVNNAIDRYYILFMLGSFQNGIYGVAYKIPAILTTIQRIFAQAWQMSAVKEYKGPDRDQFFSGMYRAYQTVLVLSCSGIILFLKPIAAVMFRGGFFEAWVLVPPLLLSVVFGALEGFLGSICLAFQDGKSMGRATGVGALANIIMNYFGILEFGSFGAAIATLFSYFTMFVLAFIFVRKHVKLKVMIIRDLLAYLLILVESLLLIFNFKNYYIINAVIVLILALLYLKEEIGIAKRLLSRSGR